MATNIDEQELRTKVLVVDDQRLLRDGISSLLSIQENIEVVGTASNGQEAVEMALALGPDVVLMDVRMPIMDGVEAAKEIRRRLPGCKVLMLTTFDDDEFVLAALRAGATGYLLKDIPAHDLARSVQAAHMGIYQLDPAVASKVFTSLGNQSQSTKYKAPQETQDNLSAREVEVLRLIAAGASNREIAERLFITEGTVKNHISNILSRLSLRDRTQAALYAREKGLL
jgi:DNA-binding NarL/FixJ family response regulator